MDPKKIVSRIPKNWEDLPPDVVFYEILRFFVYKHSYEHKEKGKYRNFGYFRGDRGRKIYYLFPSISAGYWLLKVFISFKNLFYLEMSNLQSVNVRRIVGVSKKMVKLQHLRVKEESGEWARVKPYKNFFALPNCFPSLKKLSFDLKGNASSYANVGENYHKNPRLFGNLNSLELNLPNFWSSEFFTTPDMFQNLKYLKLINIRPRRNTSSNYWYGNKKKDEIGYTEIPSLEVLVLSGVKKVQIKPGEKLNILCLYNVSPETALSAYSSAPNITFFWFKGNQARTGSRRHYMIEDQTSFVDFLKHLSLNPHPKLRSLRIGDVTSSTENMGLWSKGLKPFTDRLEYLQLQNCDGVSVDLFRIPFEKLDELELSKVSFGGAKPEEYNNKCQISKCLRILTMSHAYVPNELFSTNEWRKLESLSIHFYSKLEPDFVYNFGRSRREFVEESSGLNGIGWKVPNLLELNFFNLPNLDDLFFHQKFDLLLKITLTHCKKLKGQWNATFSKLDFLKISNCENVDDSLLESCKFEALEVLCIESNRKMTGKKYDWIGDLADQKILKVVEIVVLNDVSQYLEACVLEKREELEKSLFEVAREKRNWVIVRKSKR